MAAEFQVMPWVPLWQWSMFTHGETSGGPWADIAVSDRCGDFNPPEPWCATYATYTGQGMGRYKLPEAPVLAGCQLEHLGTYYVNLRFTYPDADHWDCNASACRLTVQNNHTP